MANFCSRFKLLREQHNYTQEQIAEKIGVSRATVAGYESEEKNRVPREETLNKIADIFNVSIDYLLGRTDIRNSIDNGRGTDPELAELLAKLEEKGAALEAKTMLRTASKMSKRQLEDILKVFEMIEADEE